MARIFVESFGCAANMAEGEMIKGLLKGHDLSDGEDADVVILNICTVKGNNPSLRLIGKHYGKKALIVSGCVPRGMIPVLNERFPGISVVSTHNIKHIPAVLDEVLAGNSMILIERAKAEKFLLPRVRKNPLIAILPISSGCDSVCSFCSTKLIKGAHVSYPEEALVKEVERAVLDGCKEIWLTGQDTSCWGLDIGKTLPQLLRRLSAVDGDFLMRLGMANPKYMVKYVDEMIALYKTGKMYSFLHIPVQSGNDAVLKRMRRQHTVAEFKGFVKKMRDAIPDLTISTDVIIGFPEETEAEFEDTVELVRWLECDLLNMSRFVSRDGTPASKMKQVVDRFKKDRSRVMNQVYEETCLLRNKRWIGWEGEVLIDEKGKEDSWIGRNNAYKQIILKGEFKIGDKVNVKVVDATYHDLRGQTV